MGVQVSYSLDTEAAEKDYLWQVTERDWAYHPEVVRVQRDRDRGRECRYRPYTSVHIDTTEAFSVEYSRVFEGKEHNDSV